jgi:hypothetical protein
LQSLHTYSKIGIGHSDSSTSKITYVR